MGGKRLSIPDKPTQDDLEIVNAELKLDGEQPITIEQLKDLREELPEDRTIDSGREAVRSRDDD